MGAPLDGDLLELEQFVVSGWSKGGDSCYILVVSCSENGFLDFRWGEVGGLENIFHEGGG